MEIWKFGNLETARMFAFRCYKIHMVVVGDDGKYWVMRPVDSEKLVKKGFKYA